jgi:hypothetical protein
MGCNCGGGGKPNLPEGNKTGGNYMLIALDGTKTYYSTESAARSANSKLGSKGLIKRV